MVNQHGFLGRVEALPSLLDVLFLVLLPRVSPDVRSQTGTAPHPNAPKNPPAFLNWR